MPQNSASGKFEFPYDLAKGSGTWFWLDTAKTRRGWHCPTCDAVLAFHEDKKFDAEGVITPSVQCSNVVSGMQCSFHVMGKIMPEGG